MSKALLPLLALLGPLLTSCSSSDAGAADDPFLGLGVAYAFAPMEGIYCSGQPTPDKFAKLKEAGIQRVICLRGPGERGSGFEEAQAAELGLEFTRWPIDGKTGITKANAEILGGMLNDGEKPVLVCCGSSNRVGALLP